MIDKIKIGTGMLKKRFVLLNCFITIFLAFGLGNLGLANSENDFRQYKLSKRNSAEFFQSLGYLVGQEHTIRRIDEKYPNSLLVAKLKFNNAFPNLKTNFDTIAISTMGLEEYEKYYVDLKKQIESKLSQNTIDDEFVRKFSQKLIDRSEANIESPFLETFLSVAYLESPFIEFSKGYKQKFSSLGHAKSKGVHIEFDLPKSWAGKEGKRPNTLKQWTSQNGYGLETINIVITDLGFNPSEIEINSTFEDQNQLLDWVMPGFTVVSSNITKIEEQRAVFIESAGLVERAASKFYMYTQVALIFFDDKLLTITCNIGDNDKAITVFGGKLIRPLCNAVLNSVVLPQLY